MAYHTLYLDAVLVGLAILFPSTMTGFFISINKNSFVVWSNTIVYCLLILLIALTGFIGDIQWQTSLLALAVILPLSIICIGLEILIGKIDFYSANKIWPKKIRFDQSFKKNNPLADIVFFTIGAVSEELVFRQIFFYLGIGVFQLPGLFVILSSAIVYGLNHIFFSRTAVLQKILSGLVYATAFYMTKSISVPILIHLFENIIMYVAANRSKR